MNGPAWLVPTSGELDGQRSLRVGKTSIDPVSREALWPGGKDRLQPQTLKVLAVLAARSGDVVTREELVQLCWDGRIVGEDVINRSISLLRQFAEKSGGFEIETIPRTGYRLIEHVSDEATGARVSAWPIGTRRSVLAYAAIATAAVATGGWLIWKAASVPPANRIAVLPFANLTGDPSQAYFSDGIAEELRAALSRAGFQVIGRTSSDAVRTMDAKAAAARLGVDNILIGSVRRSARIVRIEAQLLRGSDGVERWSQSYDRAPGDVISMQTEIAQDVAVALNTTLGRRARDAINAGATQNAAAQRLLLQALAAARAGTQTGYQRALQLFDAAIAADPRYGDAYARRAYFLEFYAEDFANTLPELASYRSRALSSAKAALALAPNLSRAHWALANYLQGVLDVTSADIEFRKAVELAPGDAESLSDYALWVLRIGSAREALAVADHALALDPLDPDAYRRRFLVLYYRGELGKALAFTRQVERDSPELFIWPVEVGLTLIMLNRLDEAQPYLERGPPGYYQRLLGECVISIRKGLWNQFDARFAKFRSLFGDLDNYQYAQVYAQLGDRGRAFSSLERAWSVRDTGLLWLRVDPMLLPIRQDGRFVALLRKMNLPGPEE